jgi:hypothetical protein
MNVPHHFRTSAYTFSPQAAHSTPSTLRFFFNLPLPHTTPTLDTIAAAVIPIPVIGLTPCRSPAWPWCPLCLTQHRPDPHRLSPSRHRHPQADHLRVSPGAASTIAPAAPGYRHPLLGCPARLSTLRRLPPPLPDRPATSHRTPAPGCHYHWHLQF